MPEPAWLSTQIAAVYLASSVKTVKVSPGPPVEETAVLSPNLLAHLPSVVHEAHEALDPEGGRCDGEGGHLFFRVKSKQIKQIWQGSAWYWGAVNGRNAHNIVRNSLR